MLLCVWWTVVAGVDDDRKSRRYETDLPFLGRNDLSGALYLVMKGEGCAQAVGEPPKPGHLLWSSVTPVSNCRILK